MFCIEVKTLCYFVYMNRTPLHIATIKKRKDLVNLLLVHEPNVLRRDYKNKTPVEYTQTGTM